MKFLVLLAFLGFIGSAFAQFGLNFDEAQKTKLQRYGFLCSLREDVSLDEVYQLQNGDFSNVGREMKCFMNCILEKAELLNKGVLQHAVAGLKLLPLLGESKYVEVMQKCGSLYDYDKCETAFKLTECFVNTVNVNTVI